MKPAHTAVRLMLLPLCHPAPSLCCQFDLLLAEDARPGALVGDGVLTALLEVAEKWLDVGVEGTSCVGV